MNGNKQETEASDCIYDTVVEERSSQHRSDTETSRGAAASDYPGMSNDKAGENPARRKPKVSWGRQIRPGLVGPLVEAERRKRWIAGQYSCTMSVDEKKKKKKKKKNKNKH
eukprot:TRINITY_DN12635_c0_g5_i1.p4 TRINITY_DN12635_c0_g5~~TRINITY_DN12635_c0_g5_i1.p4  ORF type:complete len:111 (-),score=8.63 TRINITY_DN12635_c0_g5_i1:88-420(-)